MSIDHKKKALAQLKEYTPSDTTWNSIERRLSIQESLQALPTYAPKDNVWETIIKELEPNNQFAQKEYFVQKRYLAIAATILFLVSSIFWYLTIPNNKEEFQYTQEEINLQLLETDWYTSEEIRIQVRDFCEAQIIACSSPVFKELEQELTTLNNAKTELETAMQLVGKNTDLIAQMTSIELERSVLLNEMMDQIL